MWAQKKVERKWLNFFLFGPDAVARVEWSRLEQLLSAGFAWLHFADVVLVWTEWSFDLLVEGRCK